MTMPELLTIKEAAACLKVSEETLRKWRAQGAGPPVAKLGRHLRYRKDALDQWVKEQERNGS
jgi:excisionase family DNA binding protein